MQLLVSDANILIDLEIGGLIPSLFSLDHQYSIPDVIYYEELVDQHSHLLDMGLIVKESDEIKVKRVEELVVQYPKPGRNDIFALVLAAAENCPLLTGDQALREAAENENVQVHGTIWLINEMVRTGKISVPVARNAYQEMRKHGRRLPWEVAEAMLDDLNNPP